MDKPQCQDTNAFYLGDTLLAMGQDVGVSSINTLLPGDEPGASLSATKQRLERRLAAPCLW